MPHIKMTDTTTYGESCDYCDNQEEGRHFCLLHCTTVKNMDVRRCEDWVAEIPQVSDAR